MLRNANRPANSGDSPPAQAIERPRLVAGPDQAAQPAAIARRLARLYAPSLRGYGKDSMEHPLIVFLSARQPLLGRNLGSIAAEPIG